MGCLTTVSHFVDWNFEFIILATPRHRMIPSLSTPTDNLYNFSCIFGLVLIVSAVFGFIAVYSASLEQKAKYVETKISLEARSNRSASEEQLLALQNKLIEVTSDNEKTAARVVG